MADLDELIEVNTPDLLTRMLAYCTLCPDVAQVAVPRLSHKFFNADTELAFIATWRAAQGHWQEFGSPPPQQWLREMAPSILISLGYDEPSFAHQTQQVVDNLYFGADQPWNTDFGLKLLNSFFNREFATRVQEIGQRFPNDRSRVMDLINTEFRVLDTQIATTVMDPFNIVDNPPSFEPRSPLGFGPVDMLLGGGYLPGECLGILGPSSGGKTTLAVQLACMMAEQQQHVDLWSYEMPNKDMQPRVLSCAGDIDRREIEGKQFEEMTPEVRASINGMADTHARYLHLIDRSSEGSSVVEIEMRIKQQADLGMKPAFVIIDWVWPLVMRITDGNPGNERIELQRIMEKLKALAARHQVCLLVLHQLSTEMAKKAPRAKPQWFNSAEAGAFAWLLHYCLAIGTADKHGHCWLVGSKARGAAKQDVMIRLDGAYNRFRTTEGSMIYNPNAREFEQEDDVNAMPGAARAVTQTIEQEQDFLNAQPEGGGV